MDYEKMLLTSAFAVHKKKLEKALHYSSLPSAKNSEASEKFRKDGNALFKQKNHSHDLHAEILSFYNKSVAFAPSGSPEIACAYANRSAFLLHMSKYKECIKDIEKALIITESDELEVKLLCRKVEFCKKVGITAYEYVLNRAQKLIDNLDSSNKNTGKLQEFIDKVTKLTVKTPERIQETNEAVNLPKTDNPLEKVSIRYNKKYGRHLVAEQDYNPGDIIFVEKLFSTSVQTSNLYTNCHYCMKICWCGIPCDHCNWAIFCSKECCQSAWQEYHDVECSIGHLLNGLDVHWSACAVSIKILIKALKDAGSVENLKAQLDAVDQCTDARTKGFYKEGQFFTNTLESFYSLTRMQLYDKYKMTVPQIALMVLIGLSKHAQFKNICNIEQVDDLMNNQDMVFLGCLLIRFTEIRFNNGFSLTDYWSMEDIIIRNTSESARGICMGLLVSLINNSCCPNADICFTNDGKIMLYATKLVTKNSQIFISYIDDYYKSDLEERQEKLEKYNFQCDCQACIESWPPLLRQMFPLMVGGRHDMAFDKDDAKFLSESPDILLAALKKDFGRATLEKLAPKITLAFKTLRQPSFLTCVIQDALHSCITNIYDGFKPQFLEKCEKMQ